MGLFHAALILATFFCALVAGFLFAFAVVAMPGLGRLEDREFLRAFQVMDRVIQDIHPVFMVVWVGSVVLLIAAAALGFARLDGAGLVLLLSATLVYVLGVQVPTAAVNIPLNNRLQAVDVDALGEPDRRAARAAFEPRWNRWNRVRTVFASVAAALLLFLLVRL